MTIKEVLKIGVEELKNINIQEPISKARLILAFELCKNKEYLITHDEEEIEEKVFNSFFGKIQRLIDGEPLQYLTGQQEFMKLNFMVNKNVLIPRQDTEILVEEVLNLSNDFKDLKILDMCTGSGAIAISISHYLMDRENVGGDASTPHFLSNIKIYAVDISSKALEVAKYNNEKLNANVKFLESDLFQKVEEKFNIIVSNPPYIKTSVIEKLDEEVKNEPKLALDGGQDGLFFYRKIIENAHNFLEKDGYLCLEIGYDQRDEVIDIINKTGKYEEVYSKKDLAGNDRIVVCKKR